MAAIREADRDRTLAPAAPVRPVRLTVVLTHPIQYYTPWFRHIASTAPAIDLTVLYATAPTPEQQGAGFGQPFTWDTPLLDGYAHRIVRPAQAGDRVDTGHFWGLDVGEIDRAIRDARPEVLLLPGWHSATFVRAWRTARQLGIPVLYRGDTHLQAGPAGWRRAPWIARTRRMLRQFDGWLSVGSRAEAFLRFVDVPFDRLFRAPHAVDNTFFAAGAAAWQEPGRRAALRRDWGFDEETFVLLFAGKFEEKKRPLDVIRAAGRMSGSVAVLMAGAGPLEEACRREASALGVRVTWAGFLNQSEIVRAYAAADCLVLPSDWGETWGLVVNEAMATGLPCVVSDRVGCAPDLIEPDVTGGTFAFADVGDLAAQLDRVRQLVVGGRDFGPACRERVGRSDVEAATAGLLAACQAVTAPGRAPVAQVPRVLACCGSMVVVYGLERMTFEVLSVLRERDAAVHCIVNSWENHRIVAEAARIGASWSVGAYRAPLRRRSRNPIHWIRGAVDVLRTSGGLVRDVRQFRPTGILLADPEAVARNWPGLLVCRLLGYPRVMSVQNAPERTPFYRWLWRGLFGSVIDVFVASSRFVESGLRGHGIPARKVRLVYNTVPTRRAGARAEARARDPRKVLYVGQVIPEKGVDLLLDAVGLLRRQGVDVDLDLVGAMDGWMPKSYEGFRERLRERARQPDLAGHVHFLGSREDVPALMAGAAVHCCPSRPEMREGLVLVVLEAKAAATPSVVFDVGPMREQVTHGEDGWVCRDLSVEGLAEGLRAFLVDPERARRAGAAALASSARFDRERFAGGWRAVLDGHRPSPASPDATRAVDPPLEALAAGPAVIEPPPLPTGPARRVLACCGSMVTIFGLERMTFEVLSVLRERGAAVHCIVNGWEHDRIVAQAERIGASWSVGSYRVSPRRTWNPVFWAGAILDISRTSTGLLRDARRFRPDVILLPDLVTALRNWPALAGLRVFRIQTVLRLPNAAVPSTFYRRLWRFVVSPVIDQFVCNSRYAEESLRKHGIPAGKITRIYNTVPTRATPPSATAVARDPDKVIYVGQIIPEKGVDLLLDAVGLLRRRGLDVRLDVVGQMDGWAAPGYGAFRERLRARASQPDLDGHVRFLGIREDVPALMAAAAVHCCPSRPEMREGLVLTVLEAKAAATPSVVFDVGPLREQVTHEVDGWLCPQVSAEALAEGLGAFIEHPAAARAAGERARASLAAFSRERFAAGWSETCGVRTGGAEMDRRHSPVTS
ncbi:MAG: glycosyltransferase family 4 protein [Acidobacteriota bacterium]|nr:glycosyltransferase family 4 protein [Acidobacteriota bacterium]